MNRSCRRALVAVLALLALATAARAALDATDTKWDGSAPPQGVYFHWYEPSFYAGFAPRTQDPGRLHIELSRGQQVRATVTIGDGELDDYLGDLLARENLVQELVSTGVIELSTNKEFERYVSALRQQGVAELAAQRETLGVESYRRKSAEILEALNPDRVFHLRRDGADVAKRWHAVLVSSDLGASDSQLDAANAVLPGRVALTSVDAALATELSSAAALARSEGPDGNGFREATLAFLDHATQGRYRARGGAVEALELTAIYPAGTVESTVNYKGERLPAFGVTGVWNLIRREKGRGTLGMVDYLSPNPGYGFISMLGYQYAGGIAYNVFHNAGVRCELGSDAVPAGRVAQGSGRARSGQELPEPLDRGARPDVARLHASRLGARERAAPDRTERGREARAGPHLPEPPAVLRRLRRRRRRQRGSDGRAVLPGLSQHRGAHPQLLLCHEQARALLPLALRRQHPDGRGRPRPPQGGPALPFRGRAQGGGDAHRLRPAALRAALGTRDDPVLSDQGSCAGQRSRASSSTASCARWARGTR